MRHRGRRATARRNELVSACAWCTPLGRRSGGVEKLPRVLRHASWNAPPSMADANGMHTDWEHAVVVDARELHTLRRDNARLLKARFRERLVMCAFLGGLVAAGTMAWWEASGFETMAHAVQECRRASRRSQAALASLARSHDRILAATEQAPSVGTKSWGRRFTVTKYLPNDPAYGKDNDGLTATLEKADPKSRIVAVDPKLIPYGSWVWVEDLGWFRAADCGSAIKGFRLDLLTGSAQDAAAFGRQDRFAIVVPADA